MADLYVSLSRTAGILGKPVATINHLRNDPAFPRNYNFDTASIKGRPAIKRGPFFRFDEIQQWKQRAGEFGNWDPPPGKRKTAAPGACRGDGIDSLHTKEVISQTRKKQGACSDCRWFDSKQFIADPVLRAKLRHPHNRRGRWSSCQLIATRDPGVRCSYFLNGNRVVTDGQGDRS